MTVEQRFAARKSHAERLAKSRECTDGEPMHPDHYAFRQAFRDAVLKAMDETADVHSMPHVIAADLPALFLALDPLAEKLWLRYCNFSN